MIHHPTGKIFRIKSVNLVFPEKNAQEHAKDCLIHHITVMLAAGFEITRFSLGSVLQLGHKERLVGPIQKFPMTRGKFWLVIPQSRQLGDLTLQSEKMKYPQNGRLDSSHV
jgi:hypothetical protein